MGKDEKNDNKKIKKRPIKIIRNIFSILIFAAMLFLVYSIYLISGIETEIRYIVIAILIIANILFVVLLRKFTKKDKLAKFIIFVLISFVLIVGQATIGYYVFKTYSSLDSINKNSITYETAIVVKKDSKVQAIGALKDKTIGIVNDESSIDGYVIGTEIIKEEKLNDNNTIIEYESNTELIKDLYNDKLDAIIISSNYPSMFSSIDAYENIENDTKIIHTKSKKLTKEEIAKYTGDEIINFNTSDSITKPFTILIMGVDTTGEALSKSATGNGDALMLVTFNPKTLNATIFSIPRDTYVPISCMGGTENKITHAAWGGESCMIKTIQNFTGINIDYYVKINFKGVVKLVDALGGIDIEVPEALDGVCEQNSDRKWGSKQICFKKGMQTLNGEAALAMARHRKTLATGDFQRGVHQQLVVQAMINKLKSLTSANQALEILDTVSKSMDTNFTTKQLLSFYDIAKNIIITSTSENLITLQRLYLTGSGQMIYDERSGLVLYNFIPNKSSLNEIINAMKDNLNEKHTNKNKRMEFDIEDKFEMTVIGENPTAGTTTYTLLPDFTGRSRNYAENWLRNNGVKFNIVEKEVTSGSNDIVLSQSLPESKRIDLIGSSGITITVAKIKYQAPIEPEPTEPDNPIEPEPTEPDNPNPEEPGNNDNGDVTDNEEENTNSES